MVRLLSSRHCGGVEGHAMKGDPKGKLGILVRGARLLTEMKSTEQVSSPVRSDTDDGGNCVSKAWRLAEEMRRERRREVWAVIRPIVFALLAVGGSVLLGRAASKWNRPHAFIGVIDSIQVYDHALSADEIRKLSKPDIPPPPDDPNWRGN
jgi:hypothetical protein